MKFRNWMAMGATVLLMGATGCGSDGGGGGAGGSDGTGGGKTGLVVCDLFTKVGLEAMLSTSLKAPERLSDNVCIWDPVDFQTGRSVTISLHRGDAKNFDLTVDNLKEQFETVEEISGVGDRAFQHHIEMDGGTAVIGTSQVGATKGADMVVVTVGGFGLTKEEGLTKAKELVNQMLGKI